MQVATAGSGRAVDCLPHPSAHRSVRVWVFVAVSLALAAIAHLSAGGSIAPATLVAAGAALAVVGWSVTARERSGRFITGLMVGCQLVLHACFVLPTLVAALRARAGGASNATLAALLFCHHGTHPITAAQVHTASRGLDLSHYAAGAATVHVPAGALVQNALPMLAAHLVAAALVGWWLRRGERFAWAAGRRIVAVLVRGAHPLPAVPPDRTTRRADVAPQFLVSRDRTPSPLSRRGPPLQYASSR